MGTHAKKEIATSRARLYPSTYKRLRVRAARLGKTIAQVVAELEAKDSQRMA